MNPTEVAKCIIENNDLMTVATANQDGKPWVSPVGYAFDESYNLYWVSHKDAIHSENVRLKPGVAIVIVGNNPDGNMDGVYFDATAVELNDVTELPAAIKLVDSRNKDAKYAIGSVENATGDAVWRIYKATPRSVWKRMDDTSGGQAVTVREKVDLV